MKQKLLHLSGPLLSLLSVGAGLISASSALAQAPSAPNPIVTNVSNLGDLLFCPIVNTMFYILIFLAVIMVIWAAYTYLTAGDDTEKVHRATKTITYAAVAVVVALLAKGFPMIVGSIFNNPTLSNCGGGSTGQGPVQV